MSDPLTPFLDAVRERLKVCASDPSYNEHDDCHLDLARLLALVEAGEEVINAAHALRHDTSGNPGVVLSFDELEALYHATIQEATWDG